MKIRVGVRSERVRIESVRLDGQSQFLLQLPDQRILRRFAGLDLAAGKFPKAAELLVLGTLCEQDAPRRVDQSRGRHQEEAPRWNSIAHLHEEAVSRNG